MQIFIERFSGERISIEVGGSEYVGNAKLIILDKLNLYPEQQKLIFLGSVLDDGKRIDEYPITDGCVLKLIEILE